MIRERFEFMGGKPQEISVIIPSEIENMTLPNPNLVTYYRNLENRILWLDTEVDEEWLEFSRKIIEWNREDKGLEVECRKPIKLMLFSYGGDLDVNNSFIDLVRCSKTPVWSFNMGQSCSAACFISIACSRRFAMPNSRYLIHQGGGDGFGGTFEQVMSAMEEYQRKVIALETYLVENTKIPVSVMEEKIATEWFLSAQEAVEYGICDEIITDIDVLL